MARTGNDLEGPATVVVPEIGDVLRALEACEGVAIAQLSGAGSTCFGIFADAAAAEAAAVQLAAEHPGWWVRATTLG
jgi:4-diphosphocytidyl-2-C-methyl-D-erythritol kinase